MMFMVPLAAAQGLAAPPHTAQIEVQARASAALTQTPVSGWRLVAEAGMNEGTSAGSSNPGTPSGGMGSPGSTTTPDTTTTPGATTTPANPSASTPGTTTPPGASRTTDFGTPGAGTSGTPGSSETNNPSAPSPQIPAPGGTSPPSPPESGSSTTR